MATSPESPIRSSSDVPRVKNFNLDTSTATAVYSLIDQLRSHLFDHVEHFFELKAMLSENRVCEVVELRFAVFAPVLLGVFASGSSFDYLIALAVDTRLRLARFGETETLKTSSS